MRILVVFTIFALAHSALAALPTPVESFDVGTP